MPHRLNLVLMCTLAWAIAGPVLAQSESPRRAGVIADLAGCRAVVADADRLACYDRVAASFDQAEQSGEVVVVERAQVAETRRALFGFSIGNLPLFARGEPSDRVEAIDTTVTSATRTSDGKWRLRLADGSIWQQTDTTALIRAPRSGTPVHIRQGAIGSYLLSVAGGRSMRARREQ